jgi:hypothetical protein
MTNKRDELFSPTGIALAYVVPPAGNAGDHYLSVPSMVTALLIRNPAPSSEDMQLINVGEAVPFVYKTSESDENRKNIKRASHWAYRFEQSINWSIGRLGVIRKLAASNKLNTSGAVQKDENIATLAKCLAESQEFGSLLLSAAKIVNCKFDNIERFLTKPLDVELTGIAAVENAKQIAAHAGSA